MNKGTALTREKPETPAGTPSRHPFELMRSLTDEMDRLFSDFGLARRWPFSLRPSETTEEALWSPDVEIEERDGILAVRADLPGLTRDNVKVEVTDAAITIEGERKHEEEKKGEGYYRSERSYGHFYRSIALPDGAKPDTAKANFQNGVLEVTVEVPARKAPAARRLTIEEGAKPAPGA